MNEASSTAHRMEDLLDKMVEFRVDASKDILEFLDASAMHLNALVTAKNLDNDPNLDKHYDAAVASLTSAVTGAVAPKLDVAKNSASTTGRADNYRPAPTPIVRVALDRLDDLLTVSQNLAINRSALVERFNELQAGLGVDDGIVAKISAILEAQRGLTDGHVLDFADGG